MIGSISKAFAATALMQLYEQGKFRLDDDVNDYLPFNLRNPKFPDAPITFRMLLAHQSSIYPDHITEKYTRFEIIQIHLQQLKDLVNSTWPHNEEPYPLLKECFVPRGKYYDENLWADYPPGLNANYSNFNYVFIGYLVELISGQSYEQYCRDNIFKPLDMKNTDFNYSYFNLDRLAVPYLRLAGLYIPIPYYNIGNLLNPAGGIRSTTEDLSHFLIVHMNGGVYNGTRILDESTIKEMHTIQYPGCEDYSMGFRYGLGWYKMTAYGEEYEGYAGGTYGYISKMFVRTRDNVGVIFFFNQETPNEFRNKLVVLKEYLFKNWIWKVLYQKADEL